MGGSYSFNQTHNNKETILSSSLFGDVTQRLRVVTDVL
jgi:uncharacterized protein YegP (UPF0339 family)